MLIVDIQPSLGVNIAGVQAVLNQHALNWYRFGPSSWLVATFENANQWSAWLLPVVQQVPDGRLFVCRLSPADRQGWMPQEFWIWVQNHESQ